MRNFVITVNGAQYQVAVEEVAAGAAPVAAAPAPRPATPTPPPKQDSIDLIRKRTDTPNLSAVNAPAVAADYASAASGVIDAPTPPVPSTKARVKSPTGPAPRGKRPTAEPGISQSWFDEGDRESEAAEPRRKRSYAGSEPDDVEPRRKKRASMSASSTDSIYDEVPRGKSKMGIVAAVGVVAVLGGVAFALSRGGDESTTKPPEPIQPALLTPDAGPSTIIQETPDAAPAVEADAQVASTTTTKPPPPRTGGSSGSTRPTNPTNRPDPAGPIDPGAFVLGGRPDPTPNPGTGSGSATTVVIIPGPNPNPNPGTGSGGTTIGPSPNPGTGSGSGLDSGPQDPYGGGDEPKPAGTADEFATQGQQQLNAGDATNAAVNFKKALELDPNNATATIGMGDIAMRQGLWGAAIAHLTKASKLAPKNAYVFTLLGEAHLRTSSNKEAAANFKKALQIDPNNARARDGYNEASSKVPPTPDTEE